MVPFYPQSLLLLIRELARLPGVGPKSAQRLAFYLLSREEQNLHQLTEAILQAKKLIHGCPICGGYTDQPLCPICSDDSRDQSLLCLVEQARD
ncbi:MAG: recombination protein RecR, partial [Clostridiales bacterium]